MDGDKQLKPGLTLKQLLQRFPNGIAISKSGKVFQIVGNAKNPQDLPMSAPPGGGFLIVANPVLEEGDEKLFVHPKHT
jgi:hypothetical protein